MRSLILFFILATSLEVFAATTATTLPEVSSENELLRFVCQNSAVTFVDENVFVIIQKTPDLERLKAIKERRNFVMEGKADFVVVHIPDATLSVKQHSDKKGMEFTNNQNGEGPSEQVSRLLETRRPDRLIEARSAGIVTHFKLKVVGENDWFHSFSYNLTKLPGGNTARIRSYEEDPAGGVICHADTVTVEEAKNYLFNKNGDVITGGDDEVTAAVSN